MMRLSKLTAKVTVNIDLVGASSTDPTSDTLDLDNTVFDANDDEHFLVEEELDGYEEENDDLGDDVIRGLKTKS